MMKLKKDDGVSSIVAVMLVLTVLVIGVTVFMGTYLPDLKETSELQNSEEIRDVFVNYATTVEGIYTTQQNGYYSWTITLGAGDVLFSPSKSSGLFEGKQNTGTVDISYTENGENKHLDCHTLDLSYTPVLSFWSNLGYTYAKGTVTVTRDTGARADYLTLTNSAAGYYVDGTTLTVIDFTEENGSNFKSGSGTAALTLKIEKDTANSKDSVGGVSVGSTSLSEVTKINVLKETVSIK